MPVTKSRVSQGICRGLSALALVVTGAGVAYGQDAAQDQEQSAIDVLNADIIVTATKKKDVENVQDVPVAITAFNAQSLQALQVRDIQTLTYSAPNVSLDQVGTSRGTANFSIRGLGVNSSIPSIDPTVGVFVDGVSSASTTGLCSTCSTWARSKWRAGRRASSMAATPPGARS